MKKFFSKIGSWFKNHMPTKRRLIQVYAALLYNANIKGFVSGRIYKGATKNLCVPGLNCYSCPGAIGSCPMGALQNALMASNTRAPYYVLGILVLFGIMLGRTICGFLCPVGLFQELLYKIKTPKLKKNSYTRVFSYTKYIILVALVFVIPIFLQSPTFCKYICPAGLFEGAIGLLSNPNNADMFAMLGSIFTWKFAVLVAIIVLSVFIFRFFCRFICPLGAIYGFFNRFALLGVSLDKDKCTECGLCISHCKMDIRRVGDHECIECGECISVCPTKAISWKDSKLFVHANVIDTPEEAPALAAVSEAGTEEGTEQLKPLEVTAVNMDTVQTGSEAVTTPENTTPEEVDEKYEGKPKKAEKPASAAVRISKRNRILETIAWSLAGLLLAFVLVYYNFILKEEKIECYEPGHTPPNFSLQVYDGNGLSDKTYSLEDSKGKVVVLNFWATWCNPCVNELPHFNKLQEAYGEEVEVIAVHATLVTEDVQSFINSRWSTYGVTFAQDTQAVEYNGKMLTAYNAFGGRDSYPVTAILNKNGMVSFVRQGSITYPDLEKAFLKVRNG